jgi:hypothetical protein
MRVGRLEANPSTGKGSIVFSSDFDHVGPIKKASILLDWINQLTEAYEIALREASETHGKQEN